MKIHNLKEASKTLNYLTEHGITEYDVLSERAETIAADFEAVSTSIKQMEHRMEQIAALKTHIINYAKTRDTYVAYRKTKAATNRLSIPLTKRICFSMRRRSGPLTPRA